MATVCLMNLDSPDLTFTVFLLLELNRKSSEKPSYLAISEFSQMTTLSLSTLR